MTKYAIVGKKTPREESVPKTTGEAKYAIDMTVPGMLYGKVLMSPHAHARILNIDTTKAKGLRGVKAVISANDIPDRRQLSLIGPDLPTDQYGMTRDKARYVGEPLAAVAAVDEETAEEALDLIQVEYEVLPAVFDLEEAMRPGAIQIHDHAERNIAVTNVEEYGDVEQGFKDSEYVREDTFRFQVAAYGHPEPQNAIASFDPLSGKLTVWASTQGVYINRRSLGHLLDMPWTKVRVIAPYVGGGYGGKFNITSSILCAAALSQRVGRPVKIVNSREQEFTQEWLGRHQAVFTLKTGVKKDGTLVARESTSIYDCGAYRIAIKGPQPEGNTVGGMQGPYSIPNATIKAIAVYTNKQQIGPFRDYGQYQALCCVDLQMDMIAKELGIDPMEMRLKNAVQPHTVTPFKWPIGSCGIKECLQEVGKAIDYKGRRESLPSGRGRGFSTSWHGSGPVGSAPGNPLAALVRINADGTADLMQIGTESGSGQAHTLRMLAAEGIGIPLENVKSVGADSDLFPHELGATSVSITSLGLPTVIAATKAKQAILEVVAGKLEANVQDLESKNGRVYVKGSPERGMPFAEAARVAVAEKGPIVARGEYVHPWYEQHGSQWMAQRYLKYSFAGTGTGMSFGAAGAEVEVDRETGGVQILRLAHAYDVGFAVNPLGVEGQLQGAAGLAVGYVLREQVMYRDGQVLNPSYLNYCMLTALDMPNTVPIIVEENDLRDGPFGAKELGMGAVGTAGAAVVSAIYDATGVMLKEFPATPERVLKALEGKE